MCNERGNDDGAFFRVKRGEPVHYFNEHSGKVASCFLFTLPSRKLECFAQQRDVRKEFHDDFRFRETAGENRVMKSKALRKSVLEGETIQIKI